MTSKLISQAMESSYPGGHLISGVKCRTVMRIMWRFTLDAKDIPLEDTVLIMVETRLLKCTRLTTACVLSSVLTTLMLAKGFMPIIRHFLLTKVILINVINNISLLLVTEQGI